MIEQDNLADWAIKEPYIDKGAIGNIFFHSPPESDEERKICMKYLEQYAKVHPLVQDDATIEAFIHNHPEKLSEQRERSKKISELEYEIKKLINTGEVSDEFREDILGKIPKLSDANAQIYEDDQRTLGLAINYMRQLASNITELETVLVDLINVALKRDSTYARVSANAASSLEDWREIIEKYQTLDELKSIATHDQVESYLMTEFMKLGAPIPIISNNQSEKNLDIAKKKEENPQTPTESNNQPEKRFRLRYDEEKGEHVVEEVE